MDYKLIGAIGVLGLAAGIIGLSFVDKKQKVSSIKRQILIRLLEQLKHQVFMICIKGAPEFAKENIKLKKEKQTDDSIKQFLEQKALNVYEKKERLILIKHGITKQQLEKALEKDFVKDKEISQYKQDIQVMLEDVTGGKTPVLNVPSQLKNLLKPSAALELVKNLKVAQLTVLLSQFQKAAKQNPNFTIGDNQQTTNLIRKIDLYNIKVTYLQQHGPRVKSMNHYNFIQIIELYCFESAQFKTKIDKIEYLYSIYSDMMGFEVDLEKMKQQFDKALNETTQIKQESIIQIKTPEQIKKQTQAISNSEPNILDIKQNQEQQQQKIEQIVQNQVLETKQNEKVIDSQIQQPTTVPQSQVVAQQAIQQTKQIILQAKSDSKEIENLQSIQQNESLTIQKDESNLRQNQYKIQEEQK